MVSAGDSAVPGGESDAGTPKRGRWAQFVINAVSGPKTRNEVIALSDQLVASATNFVTGVIIGRACVKEEFGLYMLGMSIVVFATTLQTSLISSPYMVFSPRLEGRSHARYTGSTLLHQLGMSAVAVLFLASGGVMLAFGLGPQGLAPVMRSLAFVITFILLREYARRICFANLQFATAIVLDLCVAVIQIPVLLLFAHFGLLSASMAYWILGISSFLVCLGWFVYLRKNIILRLEEALSDFWKNWSFGKWVFASGLLSALFVNLYPWILTFFHGTGATGVWAACVGVVSLGNPVVLGIQNSLGPRIAHIYAESGRFMLRSFVYRVSIFFSILMVPFCILLVFLGDPLVVLFFGEKYSGNGLVVTVLATNLLITAVSFSFSRALFVLNRANVDFAVNLIMLIILLTLGVWLVAGYGPLGVALGLLAGNIASLGIKGAVFRGYCSESS